MPWFRSYHNSSKVACDNFCLWIIFIFINIYMYILDANIPKEPIVWRTCRFEWSMYFKDILTFQSSYEITKYIFSKVNKICKKNIYTHVLVTQPWIIFVAWIQFTPLNNLISQYKLVKKVIHLPPLKWLFYKYPRTIMRSFSISSPKEIPKCLIFDYFWRWHNQNNNSTWGF